MSEIEAWRQRAIQAESKLREIASAPNDTPGWRDMRRAAAAKALDELPIPDPENILIYMRASGNPEFPAELCVRDQDKNYNVWGVSPHGVLNLVRIGVELIAQEKFFKVNGG